MTVSLTVGTNSYISVADATAYFDERLYMDAWITASSDDQAKALIMATAKIDRQSLVGIPAATDQALAFPRCVLAQGLYARPYTPVARHRYVDRRGPMNYGRPVSGWACQDSVPQEVIDATCEEALAILDRGNSKRRQLQQEGVTSFAVGSLRETYATGQTGRSVKQNDLISDEARTLLRPYLAGATRIT